MRVIVDPVVAVLTRTIGLEPRSLGDRALESAIAGHMARLGETDRAAFAARVEADPVERAALVDGIVVPETWFFRDGVPFRHLATHVRATWRPVDARERFRVLSVPCSTGEEPYSIAMALLDRGIPPEQFEIDAVDISAPLLARARLGIYGDNSFRGVEQSFSTAYFDAVDGGRQVIPAVRKLVQFHQDNLCQTGFLVGQRPYRAIFCRNLLIYLTGVARAAALRRIDELLAPGGLLMTGHAEALEVMDPRYRSVGVAGAFAYTRRSGGGTQPPARSSSPPASRATPGAGTPRPMLTGPPSRPTPTRPTPVPTAVAPPVPAPAPAPAPPPPVPAPILTRDRVAEARALADRGDLERAAELCQEHLRIAADDPHGHALLGTIRAAQGAPAEAEASFSRALYCDPQHYPSLIQLALLLEQRGDRDAARQLRRRAERAAPDGGRR